MNLPTYDQVVRAMPMIEKISGWFAATTVLATCGDTGLANGIANDLGFHGEDAKSAASFISSMGERGVEITAGFLSDNLKNIGSKLKHGIHDNLEQALNQAIKEAVPKLRLEMLDHFEGCSDETRKAISRLFDSLERVNFKELNLSEQEIETFSFRSHDLFEQLLIRPYNEWNEIYEKADALPDNFELAIAYGFAIIVTKCFHELLKKDENKGALIEYGISLIEYNARISHKNSERLILADGFLQKILTKNIIIGDRVQSIRETLRSVQVDLKNIGNEIQNRLLRLETLAKDNNQPMLYMPLAAYNQAGSGFDYSYKSQYTSFFGRKSDQNKLWEFFYHEDTLLKFKWWVMVGSGGLGKSRLAFEVCNEFRNSGRYAGFIDNITDFNYWGTWQPEEPTFIVIDYAATHIDKLSEIIKTLHRRNQTGRKLNYPVRFLLIERNLSGYWYDRLKENQEIMACRYLNNAPEQPVLELSMFTPPDLINMIKEIHDKKGKLDKFEKYNEPTLIKTFMRIDKQLRPLFGFFFGIALANGTNVNNWDNIQLLNYIARDRSEFWKKSGKAETVYKYENLLFLCTLCGGLDLETIESLLYENHSFLPRNDDLDFDLLESMSGIQEYPNEQIIINPYLPDILGEYFSINKIESIDSRKHKNEIQKLNRLISEAWKLRPYSIAIFILRAINDFPSKTQPLKEFYTIDISGLPDENKKHWSLMLSDLIGYFTRTNDYDNAEKTYNIIKFLPQEQKSRSILISQSICAFNLIIGYGFVA